jgi:2-methylcitrate dehydratase PrpD
MTAGLGGSGEVSMSRTLARAALATSLDAFDSSVITKTKLCLLDFLSCAFEARDHPWSSQAIAIARPLEGGSTIIGTDIRTAPGDAAFANAVLGHGLVREDMHAASIGHHGVVIWPVLLALSERTPIAGSRLLAAAIIGYETGAQIGQALFTSDLARLYRPTGIAGPLGAALAASYALRLSEDAAASAIALAANTSSGLNEWPHTGGTEMYFHPGFAARNAINAFELAEAGAYASETILEGEGGFFAAFGRRPAAKRPELFRGPQPEIMAVYNKPVPACNFAQTACQAALQAAGEIEGPSAIAAIAVRVPAAAVRYPGCDFAGPYRRPLQAKMSIQFSVAATLARGTIEEENYTHLDSPEIVRLARLIDLSEDDALSAAFPRKQGAEIRVRLQSGEAVNCRLDEVVPATPEQIRARFRKAAAARVGPGRADELEALIGDCESLADCAGIAALCSVEPGE